MMLFFDKMLRSRVEYAAMLLDDGRIDDARKVIDEAYFILGAKNILELNFPFPIAHGTLIGLLAQRARIYLSLHDYISADSMLTLIEILSVHSPLLPIDRVRLLLLKSNVMVMPNPVAHSLMILSEALKIAEEIGEKKLVAQIYMEMGKFLAGDYTALGLSLIRKAETYCKRNNMKPEEIGAKVYRARCSYMLWSLDKYKWVKDRTRFAEEAVSVLNSINPDDISSQYNRNVYMRMKAEIEKGYYQKCKDGNRLG